MANYVLCVGCPAARGPGRRAGRDEEADRGERALETGRRRRDPGLRAGRAPRRLQGRQAHRQAAPAAQHAAQRTRGCGGHRGGHRRAPVADGPAARAAVADARAQPRVLVGQRRRAEHPPHLLPRLPARLAVLPGPGPRVPPARQLRQAQPALGQPQRRHGPAARRAARPARPARRRRGLGVLLHLRRRPAAVGLGPRPGHGHPVDRPRRPAHRPRGRGAADRRPGARRLRDAAARGRARGDRERPALRALLLRSRPARDQRLHAGARRPLRPRQDRRRRPRPRALRRRRARRARRAADLRHGRLVAVLARLGRARVRPLLPPAAARVPAQHVQSHRRPRLLRHRAALRPVRARAAAALARDHAAARRHGGQAAPAAVEDLARRAARGARRPGRLDPLRRRGRPRHAVPALAGPAQGGRVRRRADGRRPGGERRARRRVRWRS